MPLSLPILSALLAAVAARRILGWWLL